MHRVLCFSRFDITATGVRNTWNPNRLPVSTTEGEHLQNERDWNHARNQQRNWETINQIISLRCLPEHISLPRRESDWWWFEFEVPDINAVSEHDQDLAYLSADADGVPMIIGLDEKDLDTNLIETQGDSITVKFLLAMDK